MGRTTQRLQERIKQHVPSVIRSRILDSREDAAVTDLRLLERNQAMAMNSAIGKHLAENATCAKNYRDERFSILGRGRTNFHLSALESTYIKIHRPRLCQQKEFLVNLKIGH